MKQATLEKAHKNDSEEIEYPKEQEIGEVIKLIKVQKLNINKR